MSWLERVRMGLKLVDGVQAMRENIEDAVVGQRVESDPIRRAKLYGQVGSLYVVYVVEE